VNNGTISGGNGGVAGTANGAGGTAGNGGAGGVGISGADLTIIDSGSISGGIDGDGVTHANAIQFTGGTNSLILQSGYNITGNVVGTGGDTLVLGGTANATFDVSNIGAAQYQGFGIFQKTGTSTWTLTNTTTAVTPWTISAGVLNVSSDGALGASSGALTLNGGSLQWSASFNLANTRSITLGSGGGTFNTNGFATTIAQAIVGTGALTKSGAGTLTLTGNNSYSGGTTVSVGELQGDTNSL
jgi:autotransporter family porin